MLAHDPASGVELQLMTKGKAIKLKAVVGQ